MNPHELKLRRKTNSPLLGNYHPECDTVPENGPENARLYASLIGILRWLVELGQIDITCEISMMSSYDTMPREGHLDHVIYIFSYLKNHHHSTLLLDPTYPEKDLEKFEKQIGL